MTTSGFVSAGLPINDADKTRAKVLVQEAYVAGSLSKEQFEARIDRIANAHARTDLDAAVRGMRPVQTASAVPMPYQWAPMPVPAQPNTGVAAFGHFSVFLGWIFGPLLTYALAAKGSFGRREAAKAFNWHVTAFGTMIVADVAAGLTPIPDITGVLVLTWFVMTIVMGVKALQGESWTNPIMKVVPFRLIDEKRA